MDVGFLHSDILNVKINTAPPTKFLIKEAVTSPEYRRNLPMGVFLKYSKGYI